MLAVVNLSFKDETNINSSAFAYYQRLGRVQGRVLRDLSDAVSLGDAAAEAGLETKYFSHFFSSKVGVPFSIWLTVIRLREAVRLFGEHDHTVTEVAFRVGFGDLRSFERAFKRQTGMTARHVRASILQSVSQRLPGERPVEDCEGRTASLTITAFSG